MVSGISRRLAVAASRNLPTRSTRTSAFVTTSVASPSASSLAPLSLIANADSVINLNQHKIQTTFQARFSTAASTQPDIKLYQYHICPFCNITKSLLGYAKLDYESVEVNPLTKSELKPWSGEYKKVPIAIIDGKQVNGSEQIIENVLNSTQVHKILEGRFAGEDNDTMTMQQFQSDHAQKWIRFASDDLAALLYPNICGTVNDSYDAFGYVKNVESWSALQKISIQSLGALAMYFAASRVKSKRNITDEKEALKNALDTYESEGLQNGKQLYSSGCSSPDLGDLAVFGVLYSVRGLAAHDAAVRLRGGPIQDWYNRMSDQVL